MPVARVMQTHDWSASSISSPSHLGMPCKPKRLLGGARAPGPIFGYQSCRVCEGEQASNVAYMNDKFGGKLMWMDAL